MKETWILLMLVAAGLNGKSQPGRSPVIELSYEYANIGMGEKRAVTVLIRKQESLSIFSAKDSLSGAEHKDFDINGEDALGRRVYKNSVTGEVVFRDFSPQTGGMDFAACIVSDPMKPMKWTYSSETTKIGKYKCKSASTDFRGRSYIAWYTEDIPISHGPWKFSGLPGAIVEIHSVDRKIVFTLTRVRTISTTEIKRPDDARVMTMSEFVDRKEKALEEFVKSIEARMPRGAQVTINSTGDYSLETDFTDVKK